MADTVGQADIRKLDLQKFVTGFADEDIVFKKACRIVKTTAREIRWQQKTSGFANPATTTGITGNLIDNNPERARPPVAGPSWTRNTSYIRKYFVESPLLSDEDIKDSDIDLGVYVDKKREDIDIQLTAMNELSTILHKEVEVQILNNCSITFAYRVISEGKIIFQKMNCLSNVGLRLRECLK